MHSRESLTRPGSTGQLTICQVKGPFPLVLPSLAISRSGVSDSIFLSFSWAQKVAPLFLGGWMPLQGPDLLFLSFGYDSGDPHNSDLEKQHSGREFCFQKTLPWDSPPRFLHWANKWGSFCYNLVWEGEQKNIQINLEQNTNISINLFTMYVAAFEIYYNLKEC